MFDFLGDLFSSSETTETTTSVEPWEPTQEGLEALVELITQALSDPLTLYPEQMYADITEEELAAIASLIENAALYDELVIPTWESLLGAADVASNEYVLDMAAALEQQVNENLLENLLPAIDISQVAQGGYGTSEGVAQGIALEETQNALTAGLADLYLGSYETGLQAVLAALGLSEEVLTGEADLLMEAGEELREEEQLAIDEAILRYDWEQYEPYLRADLAGTLLTDIGSLFSTTAGVGEVESTPSIFEMITTLLGGGSTLIGGLSTATAGGSGMEA